MRALVTGSSGFVGSHLAEELVRRQYIVRVLLRSGSSSVSPWLKDLPIESARADFSDAPALIKALENVDIIFHVGGVTKAVKSEEYIEGNAVSTKALLDAALSVQGIRRFVLVSSIAMAGPVKSAEDASREDDVPRPVEAYGRAKLAAELVARAYSRRIPITIIRPPTVYGPRDKDCLEMFKMIKKRVNLYYGNAKKYTSIIFVRDLVRGMIAAAESPAAQDRAYFLCNDDALTWREIQEGIKGVMQRRALTVHIPAFMTSVAAFFGELVMRITKKPLIINREKAALGRPRYWIASNERARGELGFRQETSFADGLAETYAWYKENGWL